MLISITLSSKRCSRTLFRLQARTNRIHKVGLPQPRTCVRHTGTGRVTLSLLPKLSLWRPSISSHLMDKRPPCRTHFSNTPSTLLIPLSRTHTAAGKRRSGTRTTLTALTRPRMWMPSQSKATLYFVWLILNCELFPSDLQGIQDDITSSTYNLLTRVKTWPAFSNHTAGDGGSASNSLEAIHDEIHGTIGGQMGDPSVAGKFCDLTLARVSDLSFLQALTLFSSCITQMSTV